MNSSTNQNNFCLFLVRASGRWVTEIFKFELSTTFWNSAKCTCSTPLPSKTTTYYSSTPSWLINYLFGFQSFFACQQYFEINYINCKKCIATKISRQSKNEHYQIVMTLHFRDKDTLKAKMSNSGRNQVPVRKIMKENCGHLKSWCKAKIAIVGLLWKRYAENLGA